MIPTRFHNIFFFNFYSTLLLFSFFYTKIEIPKPPACGASFLLSNFFTAYTLDLLLLRLFSGTPSHACHSLSIKALSLPSKADHHSPHFRHWLFSC